MNYLVDRQPWRYPMTAAVVIIDTTLTAATAYSAGAAWGHTVVELSGRRCSCGARGCLAAYVSAPAILARHREMTRALVPDHPDMADEAGSDGELRAALAELVASASR